MVSQLKSRKINRFKIKWLQSPQHSPQKTFYAVKRTSGTPNGWLPLNFLLNVRHSATAIYNVFMSERCTNWCFAHHTYYTLFSGHCYFLTFRLCCFGIFQGKYYESSFKLKIFQSSNYTLEVPGHNGHLWLPLQGHLPDSPQDGRIQIPQSTLCLAPSPQMLLGQLWEAYYQEQLKTTTYPECIIGIRK